MKVLKGVVKIVGIVATVLSVIPGPHQPIAAAVAAIAGVASAALEIATPTKKAKPNVRGSPTEYRLDPNAGIPYMVGRTQYAGTCVKRETWGTDNRYQCFTSVYSYGPITAIDQFTADRNVISFDGSGRATNPELRHNVEGWNDGITDIYFMHLSKQLGATPSPVLDPPIAGLPGWGATSKLSGLAASHWVLTFDPMGKLYTGGPPTPGIIGRGVKVYDPRLDSTYPGGSGACRALQESTYVESENPHLHALTYALGRYQNGKRRMGIGFPIDSIDVQHFVDAANVDDANNWKVGGVFFATDSKWNTLKWLMEAGGGQPITLGGKLSGSQSAPKVSAVTINNDDIVGRCSIAATRSFRDRINTGIPRYRSEAHGWEFVSGGPVAIGSYIAADRNVPRTREFEWTLVQQIKQASQLTAYEIMNAREIGPIEIMCKPRFMGVAPGDCVTLNVTRANLVNQKAVVIGRSLDVQTGAVTLRLISETDGKHADALAVDGTAPPIPNLAYQPDATPPPPNIPVITWTASSGLLSSSAGVVPSLRFSGNIGERADVTGIEFSYRVKGSGSPWTISGNYTASTTRVDITAVVPGQLYETRVRYQTARRWTNYINLDDVTIQPVTASSATIADSIVGQGSLATRSNVLWDTMVVGDGKPANNAGTIGLLTALGAYSTVAGNTLQKTGGTHGDYEGGARGEAQRDTAFVSSSLLSAEGGGGWETTLVLDESKNNFNPSAAGTWTGKYLAGAGTGTVYLSKDGVSLTWATVPVVTNDSRMALVYDGSTVAVLVDGVEYVRVTATADKTYYPKVIDYYNSAILSGTNKIIDIRYGVWSMVPDIDKNVRDSGQVGRPKLTRSELKTDLGTAAAIAGQGSGATANNLTQLNATEGGKLTGIETGADVTSYISGPPTTTINYQSDGSTAQAGQLPKTIGLSFFRNGVNVASSAAWTTTVTAISGTCSASVSNTAGSKGVLTLNSLTTNSATVRVTASYGGISRTFDLTFVKSVAQASTGSSGGGGGTNGLDTTFGNVTSTTSGSPNVISDEITVTIASGVTQARCIASLSFSGVPNAGVNTAAGAISAKAQWWNGSSWVDVNAYVAHSQAYSYTDNGDGDITEWDGVLTFNVTKTGLTAGSSQKFRLVSYATTILRLQGSAIYVGGSFQVKGDGS